VVPNNLPRQVTSFVGRKRELAEVTRLLTTHSLVTLTGPGGTGKTRLGLQAAAEALGHFGDGVFFVSLAPLVSADLLPSTIARALGVDEAAGRPLLNSLKEFLKDKQLLLVLDNFEHVVDGAPLVAELLATRSQLKVLATSRVPLQLSGEHTLLVPPLALPDRRVSVPPRSLGQYEAVELFVERARAVKPDFSLTSELAPFVAEICDRLDGLPLAIELAAARLRALSPATLLDRLAHRLPLLTGGPRDAPARQQTLRNTIAWSYDLLSPVEQVLFRRLSTLRGCTLDAVDEVCSAPPPGQVRCRSRSIH
jgi:predicted ATPase